MIGLSNAKIDSALMLEIIKEYRNFISGGGVSNNLVNFIDPKTESDKALVNDFVKNFSKDAKEGELQFIKDAYLYPMLDNTTGAYFLKDILEGKPFVGTLEGITSADGVFTIAKEGTAQSGAKTANLSDYFYIMYEDIGKPELQEAVLINSADSGFVAASGVSATDPASVIMSVTPVRTEYTKKVLDDFAGDEDFLKDDPSGAKDAEGNPKKVSISGNFATATVNPESVHINGKKPKNVSESSREESPGLGAVVIRSPEVAFGSRNSEQLNIFFNAITPLEMSRCVPYINVAVVTLESDNRPKNMNSVTFMRFIKKTGDKSFSLDENIGIEKGKTLGYEDINTLFSNNLFEENTGHDISLMDIFTSPQTLANPDINNGPTDLDGTGFGSKILEPISPFLTLNSLSVDIAGMGSALFSSKVGSMNLTLHDRSRLNDIGALVGANQFGATKVIIEYGWSHPEGGPESTNIIGKFLNAMRDRAVYTVKSSNFSFSDGNTVKIDLSLACYGADEARSVSAAAGAQIPLSTFKDSINRIINDVLSNASSATSLGSKEKAEFREVRHLMRVGKRNTTGPSALITYDKYAKLVALHKNKDALLGAWTMLGSDPSAQWREALTNLLSINTIVADGEVPSKEDLKTRIDSTKIEAKENATQLLYGKMYALVDGFKDDNSTYNADPLRGAIANFASTTVDLESINTQDVVSLGKVCMSYIGHSLAMSGLFDEVQMFFYPMNESSGGARVHTTASFPIEKKKLEEVIVKKVSRNSNLTVNGVFNLIERKIIRDKSQFVYGISSAINEYETYRKSREEKAEALKAKAADEDASGEVSQETKDAEQAILDQDELARKTQKESISQKMTEIYANDGGVPSEPKFIRPNLSMYMESLTVNIPDPPPESKSNYTKTICRVHIYDEESSNRPQEALLNSLIAEGSAGKVVVKGISGDTKIVDTCMDSTEPVALTKTPFEENLVTYVKKADATVIKQAIKRAYPSITYGTSTGVIKNISISSNVSNQVSQTILISSFAKSDNPQDSGNSDDEFEEVTVVPASVTVEMLGCPFIQRGNQVYLDFGTSTTLDNIYIVKSVRHSLSAGNFSTSIELTFSGQGQVSSTREKIINAIGRV
jgi:hypothetical protein